MGVGICILSGIKAIVIDWANFRPVAKPIARLSRVGLSWSYKLLVFSGPFILLIAAIRSSFIYSRYSCF